MPKKKKRPRPKHPLPLKWEFEPGIPTDDFFEGRKPEDALEEALENFIFCMETDKFLTWEAVVTHEQGLALTQKQQAALNDLISFSDSDSDDDQQIFYIDEIPRASEPWYVILGKIVPCLLMEPFRTFDVHYVEQCEGWGQLAHCLRKHADGLSLPHGVSSAVEVIPTELRHALWLQDCFDALSGLGQDAELTLENEEQRQFQIDDFVESLREHKDSVRYFDLTLDSLLTKVIVPERDRPILIHAMQEELRIGSTADRLADYL